LNDEIYDTIQELREHGKKWMEIFKYFDLKFPSVTTMKDSFVREQARRRTT